MACILVIDDAPLLRTILRRFLETAGYEVVEAEDGLHGVDVYRQTRPQLVISDMVMPRQDGIATLQELRRLDPEVKVIAISGGQRTCEHNLLEEARSRGANATLAKPFGRETILGLVGRVLS
jgi:two-component system chemotaxis response regulator CheY